MTFDKFKQVVRAIGGVWELDAVTFLGAGTGTYTAIFNDSAISCRWPDGFWYGRGKHAMGISFVREMG